jgi:hypothetical protein
MSTSNKALFLPFDPAFAFYSQKNTRENIQQAQKIRAPELDRRGLFVHHQQPFYGVAC